MSTTSPDFELLLKLARPELDPSVAKRVQILGAQIKDWKALARCAEDQMIAALAYQHLSHLGNIPWTDHARKALRPIAQRQLQASLRRAAFQKSFIEEHLLPSRVPFAIVKGSALAQKYYQKPWLRTARDVDVWLPNDQLHKVVHSAQRKGFVVYPYRRKLSSNELLTHLKLGQGIALYDKRGVLVELDSRMGKLLNTFNFSDYQARFQEQEIDGLPIKVLSTTDLFIYICLHHTNHRWNRLIWLADIHALRAAPDFDEAEIRLEARRLGVENTVGVALLLADTVYGSEHTHSDHPDQRVIEILDSCTLALKENKTEKKPKRAMIAGVGYEWQLSDSPPKLSWLRRMNWIYGPNMRDLRLVMLPPYLFFLYYGLKPIFIAIRRGSVKFMTRSAF